MMQTTLAAAAAASLPRASAGQQRQLYAGAIRWDAWDAAGSSVNRAVATSLSPEPYHNRAPFCATEHNGAIDFNGCDMQAAMDAEIAAAAGACISYWAYCWYGEGDAMMRAWSLHQSSAMRNHVHWCLLLQFSRLFGLADKISGYVTYFRQANYQRDLGGRPLLYLNVDQPDHLATDWRGNWANLRAVLENLASECKAASIERPYVVVMSGSPAAAREVMQALAADAISNYTGRVPTGQPAPYTALAAATQSYWVEMAATGVPIVPICMTGWDTRPRKLHPPPWEHGHVPGTGMDTYVAAGTPAEIAAHVGAAVTYIDAHPAACPARALLIYSWDECDEGGSALIPTYAPSGPNHAILDAVGGVLRRRAHSNR